MKCKNTLGHNTENIIFCCLQNNMNTLFLFYLPLNVGIGIEVLHQYV